MANVCVITGGGRGIGLETAKNISKEKILVLADVEVETLENAVRELRARGYTAFAKYCDVSNVNNVKELAKFALELGNVKQVVHAAETSAKADNAERILRWNIFGTVYVNQIFSKVMKGGGVIVDVGSYTAYEPSALDMSKKVYATLETDAEGFWQKIFKKVNALKEEDQRKAAAYALSKNFVIWYAKKCACDFGEKGVRVVSVSPGILDGEADETSADVALTAQKRMGKPAEVGYLLATVADERNGFLVGVDVLCDGGMTTRKLEFKK